VIDQEVGGWAIDAGVTYLFPSTGEPRITLGYALGSADHNQDDGIDRSYRQTGLHTNEPGFGGVQRFRGYGRLLDPELSNLGILTVGLGCSLLRSSSLDLVLHDYRLVERAETLRDARLETALTGEHRGVGQSLDLVLAIEEWRRFEFEVSASVFRGGEAFGADKGEWIFGSFLAARIAF